MSDTETDIGNITNFFDEDRPANRDPTEPFFNFMDNHEVDFFSGEVRRIKNGS